MHATASDFSTRTAGRFRWRVVDIVIAAVLAAVTGVIFWLWAGAQSPISVPVQAALPGLQGLLNGPWLFAGVLGGLVVRKPGAALFVELVAAVIEALLGNQWGGPLTLLSGVTQGLGAEVIFAIFLYKRWNVGVAVLAGAGAGVGEAITDLVVWYPGAAAGFAWVYALSTIVSGALVGGLVSWLLVKALAKTGALSRFAAGREATARV